MKLFNKVAIVGTGLIGGSIALAMKKKQLANEVIGVSRHKKSILLAQKRGAIDKGSLSFDIIKDADLLILATPVDTIIELAPLISKIIRKGCMVTDVGSTKKELVKKLDGIFPLYVGSHPLAGSEKRSIANAHSNIFKDSLCILTPTKKTNDKVINKIRTLWSKMGAEIVLLTPQTHDKILSFVSHLPHITAFSLIDVIPRKYLKFASSGLRDTTRIAASDSRLWTDIFLSNSKNIIKNIELLQDKLSQIKLAIQKKDRKRLSSILKKAKNRREALG